MRKINLLICFAIIVFASCVNGKSNKKINVEKQNLKSSENKEIVEEKNKINPENQDYKGAEIAFVKQGKLYFYYPEVKEIKELVEETEPVFNCVFDNTSDIIYYTVERDSVLWFKKADYQNIPVKIKAIGSTNVKKESCITSTNSEKSILIMDRSENIILPFNFVWDFFEFEKTVIFSTAVGDLIKKGTFDYKDKEYFFGFKSEMPHKVVNNNLIYKGKNLTNNINLEVNDGMDIEFTDFKFSKDKSKLLFGAFLTMGDLAHGPICVANTDGSNQKLLMTDGLSDYFKPFLLRNRVVFMQKEKGEKEFEYFNQLYITNAVDNSVSEIDKGMDYFTVRETIK